MLLVPIKSMLPCSKDSGFFSDLENANQFCKQEFLKLVVASYTDSLNILSSWFRPVIIIVFNTAIFP